jgi:hypothetical protein
MPGQIGFLRDYQAPIGPYDAGLCISVPHMAPVLLGALETRAHSFCYSDDSAFSAVQAVREVQVSIITGVRRLDDIYRLIDTVHNGTIYELNVGGDVTPEIPLTPRLDFEASTDSTRRMLFDIRALIESGEANTDEIEALLNTLILAIG